jgi:ribosomal-protein-alanine N-acetyltransferase
MDRFRGDGKLLTARLSLLRPTEADVDAVLRIHRDPRAWAHNPGDALADRGAAEDRFRSWDSHWERHGFGYWTVRRSDALNGEPLGFCGLKEMELHGRPVLNLFYRLDPAAWGNGFATEAATAVVTWAAMNRPGRPLIARVRPGNVASLRVATHAGLERAPELDTAGEDGLDWIFARNWPATP